MGSVVPKVANTLIDQRNNLDSLRLIIKDTSNITQEELDLVVATVNANPQILDSLSLTEFDSLSSLGLDLSSYVSQRRSGNLKAYTFRYANASMKRCAKIVEFIDKLESKFMEDVSNREYVPDELMLKMITTFQGAVNDSLSTMLKLTESEALSELFYSELIQVSEDASKSVERKVIISKSSRSKVLDLVNVSTSIIEGLKTEEEAIEDYRSTRIKDDKDVIDVT